MAVYRQGLPHRAAEGPPPMSSQPPLFWPEPHCPCPPPPPRICCLPSTVSYPLPRPGQVRLPLPAQPVTALWLVGHQGTLVPGQAQCGLGAALHWPCPAQKRTF